MSSAPICFQRIFLNHAANNVTTAAWVVLDTAMNDNVEAVEIFDSSGEVLLLGYGAAGAEVDYVYIHPGGNGRIPLILNKDQRLCVKAVSANTTEGFLVINCYT